jgi:hypothetical protein
VLVALCTLAVAALLLSSHASAAPLTFTVDSNGDQPDQTIDGTCATAVATCTLRAAIQEANANSPDADTINFAGGVTGQILLTSALPAISDPLTINGPGPDQLAIDGANTYRVLETQSPTTASVSGLTIRHGLAPVSGGGAVAGGILAGGTVTLDHVVVTDNSATVTGALGDNVGATGGGIVSGGGTLTLTHSTVANNQATASTSGTGQAFSSGGGMELDFGATLHVDHSTISGNDATATITAGSGNSTTRPSGGGIYQAGGTLTIDESTISGNSASGSGGTEAIFHDFAEGGGVYQDNSSTLTVSGSTVSGNTLSVPAGGPPAHEFTAGANFQLLVGGTFQDTIVANPVGATNCSQDPSTFTSNGYNLEDDSSPASTCNFTQSTDISGQDPMLGPLANHGGPTATQNLLAGSPAIDKGKSFGATTDQRGTGFPRISDSPTIVNAAGGDGSDIGAYERDSVPPHNPAILSSIPKSPANNNNPKLKGLAAAGSIVRIYKTAGCTGSPVKAGSASTFTSTGVPVTVANNTTTIFHATATDSSNNTSTCSPGFTYVEDSTPPNTSITSTTLHPKYHSATLAFSSTEAGSTFQCRIDGGPFASCTSPKTYSGLAAGHHTFSVRAIDKAGNVDATPAGTGFDL